jgi:tellurite resistance protein TerC
MTHNLTLFAGFTAAVIVFLLIDLWFSRRHHTLDLRTALKHVGFWFGLTVAFAIGLWIWRGGDDALKFTTGYLIEQSLSMDNVFVIMLIFSWFAVPDEYQRSILFWGIAGAMVFRGLFIFLGVAFIEHFHWSIYILGAFLVFAGLKILKAHDRKVDPTSNLGYRLIARLFPITREWHDGSFFKRIDGRLYATPMLMVLVVVETTDIVFAVDSIPAIIAVTTDSFIVYSSNLFAILGLRALYFVVAGFMKKFRFLNAALCAILMLVGTKMLFSEFYKPPVLLTLGLILLILAVSVTASLMFPRKRALASLPDAHSDNGN